MSGFRAAVALALVAGMTAVAPLHAQGKRPLRPGRAGGGRAGAPAAGTGNRQETERLVRQAMARAVRKQLNLNDDQMAKLQRANGKFEQQQRQLLRQEAQTRRGLRDLMLDTASRAQNQAKISQDLDQLVQIQHKRADLLESEQKELAEFLTPMQRAQFLALRERITKRIQELQAQPAPGAPPARPDTIP